MGSDGVSKDLRGYLLLPREKSVESILGWNVHRTHAMRYLYLETYAHEY